MGHAITVQTKGGNELWLNADGKWVFSMALSLGAYEVKKLEVK